MLKNLNWYNIFIHIMLIGLSVIVILLLNKNNKLEEKLYSNKIDNLKEGDSFENILAYNIEGIEDRIDFSSGKDKLLFLFTTTCKFCTENIPTWKKLYEEDNDKYEVIGLGLDSLESIKSYSQLYNLPYKILIPTENDFRKKYKIMGVPQTIYFEKNIVKEIKIGTF